MEPRCWMEATYEVHTFSSPDLCRSGHAAKPRQLESESDYLLNLQFGSEGSGTLDYRASHLRYWAARPVRIIDSMRVVIIQRLAGLRRDASFDPTSATLSPKVRMPHDDKDRTRRLMSGSRCNRTARPCADQACACDVGLTRRYGSVVYEMPWLWSVARGCRMGRRRACRVGNDRD